jgi:hypothetical protein
MAAQQKAVADSSKYQKKSQHMITIDVPEEFIGWISQADCVSSSSFNGFIVATNTPQPPEVNLPNNPWQQCLEILDALQPIYFSRRERR